MAYTLTLYFQTEKAKEDYKNKVQEEYDKALETLKGDLNNDGKVDIKDSRIITKIRKRNKK